MTRDRTGEPLDDEPAVDDPWHQCDRGWISYARRHPCAICRPWLVARPARPPTRRELERLRQRHATP